MLYSSKVAFSLKSFMPQDYCFSISQFTVLSFIMPFTLQADLSKRGVKTVQVGFPLLYVCMVALVSVFLGYYLHL